MQVFAALLLVFLLAAPDEDAAGAPQTVIEEMAASVRAGNALDVYDRLTPAGQERLRPVAVRAAKMLGLDPEKATTRDIVAAFEKRIKADDDPLLRVLAQLKVEVGKVERLDENTAKILVRGTLLDRNESAIVTLKRADGQWKVDDLGPPLGVRRDSNETAAIATLRNIVSAQSQFQAVSMADTNQNGEGEYGFFGELSGAVAVRGGDRKIDPPVLSQAFREVKNGTITRSGYHFRIFLPDAKGAGVTESGVASVDAGKAQRLWCCYAWPEKYGETGKRTFFINQDGDLIATDHAGYTGDEGPAALAAYVAEEGKPPTLASPLALAGKGHDGHDWKPVG